MTLEARKLAAIGNIGNMHIDTTVIEVPDFNSELKFEIWGHQGDKEPLMASEAT